MRYMNRIQKILGQLAGVIFIIVLWIAVTHLDLVSPLFLPSPYSVLRAIWQGFIEGGLGGHFVATIIRVSIGCAIGLLIGIATGSVVGYSKILFSSFEQLADFFRSIPIVCMFPLFLIIFGIGDKSKIATATWSTTFVVFLNTASGIRQTNETRLMVARNIGAKPLQIFFYVFIPEALPSIMAGIRVGISLGLIVVLVAEMFMGTRLGIGRFIFDASMVYDTPNMYAGILITGLMGYSINRFFSLADTKLIHWCNKI